MKDFVNKRLCEILGYTYEEIVDKISPIDSAHPEDRKIVENNIHKRLTGQIDNIEYTFRTLKKDGEVIITKRNGKKFVLKLVKNRKSPLDVPGIQTDMSREEILDIIKEVREKDINERRDSYGK